MMIDKIEDKLKKVHLVIVILGILLFQYIMPFADQQAGSKQIEKIIVNHETRITNLESGYLGNRELLLEIKFNLKQHMNDAGGHYIDNENTREH